MKRKLLLLMLAGCAVAGSVAAAVSATGSSMGSTYPNGKYGENYNAKPAYDVVPSVVFTLPPLAAVGLREDQASESGLSFVSHRQNTSDWSSSRRVGEAFSAWCHPPRVAVGLDAPGAVKPSLDPARPSALASLACSTHR